MISSTTWPPRSARVLSVGTISRITDAVADAVPRVAARVRWRSPLPGGLPQARFGPMVRACSPGRLPLGPYRGRGGAWTGSSTWLKDLGPGPEEGASLKGGLCAPVPAQPQRRGLSDRRGGTSRTGAKRAGECDGLTGLPEAIEATWPQATVPTCVVHAVPRPGCGSCPTGTAGRSRPLSRPICTAPSQEAAWQALTDFSESDLDRPPTP